MKGHGLCECPERVLWGKSWGWEEGSWGLVAVRPLRVLCDRLGNSVMVQTKVAAVRGEVHGVGRISLDGSMVAGAGGSSQG